MFRDIIRDPAGEPLDATEAARGLHAAMALKDRI
jgi:hypothetical protein